MIIISIILPTHNGEGYIRRSIESVIAQSFSDWELLVINDGSIDNTEKIISEYVNKDKRIIYIKNDINLGITKSLNKGIELSKGEYIARIDDDDEWIDRDKLQKQIDFFKNNPGFVLVGTSAKMKDSHNNNLGEYALPNSDKKIRSRILSKNCFIHSSIMAKKSSIEEVGLYEEAFKCAEDYDLWLKLGLRGKMANLNSCSVALTIHPNSITSKNRITQAKNALSAISLFKGKYPYFIVGYTVGLLRFLFFVLKSYIPVSNKLIYNLQRIYKNI